MTGDFSLLIFVLLPFAGALLAWAAERIKTESDKAPKTAPAAVRLSDPGMLTALITAGLVLAGLLGGNGITAAAAFALATGIAIQNFPEGAIISLPLASEGMPRKKAFLFGFSSGVVEPVGALVTIALTRLVTPVLPYILSFAAGAMLYVVIEELIPESQNGNHSNLGTIGAALGFVLMMVLDVVMG